MSLVRPYEIDTIQDYYCQMAVHTKCLTWTFCKLHSLFFQLNPGIDQPRFKGSLLITVPSGLSFSLGGSKPGKLGMFSSSAGRIMIDTFSIIPQNHSASPGVIVRFGLSLHGHEINAIINQSP